MIAFIHAGTQPLSSLSFWHSSLGHSLAREIHTHGICMLHATSYMCTARCSTRLEF